jgi:hypothetical protein
MLCIFRCLKYVGGARYVGIWLTSDFYVLGGLIVNKWFCIQKNVGSDLK